MTLGAALIPSKMIAIHDSAGTYSERWISYCEAHGVAFRRINCLAPDIIGQSRDVAGVLWHWRHDDPTEKLFARHILAGFERQGVAVFPNLNTCAHYDDKVAQKYLLEAIGAPLVPTWTFFRREAAMEWIAGATWPKVFKLRCGAGSDAVRLVRDRAGAEALCCTAFARGFVSAGGYFSDAKTRLRKAKTWEQFWARVRRAPVAIARKLALRRETPRERGYVYFQEFLPCNAFDTRVTVIGDRAFGFIRRNRPDDFRASGSGNIVYDRKLVDARCVQIAFDVTRKLGGQSLAFDFLFDPSGTPMIGEISYCYMAAAVHACEGHWDSSGTWHDGRIWPEHAIIEDLLASIPTGSRVPLPKGAS
jgi:hypothetical protein